MRFMNIIDLSRIPAPANPAAASERLWVGADHKPHMVSPNGERQGLNGGLASLITPVVIATSSAEVLLLGYSMPANFMVPGTSFRVTAHGIASTSTTAPTMTWRVRIGTTTLLGNIAALIAPTPAISQTGKPWSVDFLITVRSATVSGTVIGNGICMNELSTTAPNFLKGSGIANAVAVDTTAVKLIELTFQYGIANASNTLTCHNAVIELVDV